MIEELLLTDQSSVQVFTVWRTLKRLCLSVQLHENIDFIFSYPYKVFLYWIY